MRGHTLVWYGAMPSWTKEIRGTAEAERELTNHIEKVVSRYRGKIKTWHVVNEPIDDIGARSARYAHRVAAISGPKYIEWPFAWRSKPIRRPSFAERIRYRVHWRVVCSSAAGASDTRSRSTRTRRAAARGWTAGTHPGKYQIDEDGLYKFVSEIKSLGLSVHVTELDVIDKDFPGPVTVRDAIVAARAYDFLNSISPPCGLR